jgi:hypothetical protein
VRQLSQVGKLSQEGQAKLTINKTIETQKCSNILVSGLQPGANNGGNKQELKK